MRSGFYCNRSRHGKTMKNDASESLTGKLKIWGGGELVILEALFKSLPRFQ